MKASTKKFSILHLFKNTSTKVFAALLGSVALAGVVGGLLSVFVFYDVILLERTSFLASQPIRFQLNKYSLDEVTTIVKDARGRVVPVAFASSVENGKESIILSPEKPIKPGEYTLTLKDKQSNEEYSSQFSWGVLVVNSPRKSIVNQPTEFHIGALDEEGHTLCEADLELSIVGQGLEETYSVADGTIVKSDSCGADNVTDLPDYTTTFVPKSAGKYEIILKNLDKEYQIQKQVVVEADQGKYQVVRQGATRINPFKSQYTMNFEVTASEDFTGNIVEYVPRDFYISESADFSRKVVENTHQLTWQVEMAAGETKNFSYEYQAPLKSPFVFTLGPVTLQQDDTKVYSEHSEWQLASDASATEIAALQGTATSLGTNLNQAASPMVWSTSSFDTTYYSHTPGSTQLTINQDGDYFFSLTLPITSTNVRVALQSEIRVNGTILVGGSLGATTYIRNASGNDEASNHVAMLVENLTAGDYVEVLVGQEAAGGTVTVTGQASLFAEYIGTSREVFTATGTQTTSGTDFNTVAPAAIQWNNSRVDTGFTHTTGSHQIQLDDAADYFVTINLPLSGASNHTNVRMEILLDGTVVTGGNAKQGMIRNAGGHNTSSLHWSGSVSSISTNQILTIQTSQEANIGTVTVPTGKVGSIYIEKLPNSNVYIGEGFDLVGGTDWNAITADPIKWSTDRVIDTATFSHNEIISNDQITVLKSGDYVLAYNDSLTTGVARANTIAQVTINGTPLTGAQTKSHYIRNQNNHTESSGSLVFLLEDLTAGDIIAVTTQNEGNSGVINDDQSALLYLRYKPPLAPNLSQLHFHWRNDDGSETAATSATSGVEDAIVPGWAKEVPLRLRLQVSNDGLAPSASTQYRIEYGLKSSTCAAIVTWTDVGAVGGDWDMSASTHVSDGDDTTNIAVANGGTTDENTTFYTPNGAVKTTSSETAGIVLTQSEFLELEYSIVPTAASTKGATYCMRVTNAGTPIDSYITYPTISLESDNDFKVQRGTTSVTGTSTILIAGTDYEAPASSARSFVRITNTQLTGAGNTTGGGSQNADDVTAWISNGDNLVNQIEFTRPTTASGDTLVDWEIVEYIGPTGGDNEFVVRQQDTLLFGAADASKNTPTVPGVVDDSKIAVFITGQGNPSTGRADYSQGFVTAAWDALNDQVTLTRNSSGTEAPTISWAAIEFTGNNWIVQRAEHIYTAAGVEETETITAVNDLSRAFIHVQKRYGNLPNVAEIGHEVWLSATNTLSFQLDAGATTPASHASVAWVIENTQTKGAIMDVTRSNGVQTGGGSPTSVLIPIGKTLTDVSVASIFTNSTGDQTNRSHPRSKMGAIIFDTTQYQLWASDGGGSRSYRTEVVEWPTADAKLVMSGYKWFVNDSTLSAGEAMTSDNVEIANKEPGTLRLRILTTAVGRSINQSTLSLKLQVAQAAIDGCDTAFVGETYTDASLTAGLLYDDPSLTDADQAAANVNDLTAGNPLSYQEYRESDPATNSHSDVSAGTDAVWDYALADTALSGATAYCFRLVYNDDALLDTYSQIPSFVSAPLPGDQLRHGQFFSNLGVRQRYVY